MGKQIHDGHCDFICRLPELKVKLGFEQCWHSIFRGQKVVAVVKYIIKSRSVFEREPQGHHFVWQERDISGRNSDFHTEEDRDYNSNWKLGETSFDCMNAELLLSTVCSQQLSN